MLKAEAALRAHADKEGDLPVIANRITSLLRHIENTTLFLHILLRKAQDLPGPPTLKAHARVVVREALLPILKVRAEDDADAG